MPDASNSKIFYFKNGQALLTTVIFLLFISTALMFGLSTVALSEIRASRGEENSLKSFVLAEAGVEDLSYRIQSGKQYSSPESLTLDGATTVTTVTNLDAATRQVVSSGNVLSRVRSVETLLTSTNGASFHYGTQIGDGGLEMDNSSRVNGSVYSNGNIVGNNEPRITGDAFAAVSSTVSGMTVDGNARANRLEDNAIGGSATSSTVIYRGSVGIHGYADTFSGGTISGNAYYNTSVSATTTVDGLKIQESPAPANLPKLDMPISDALLDQWENEAAANGITNCSGTYEPPNGSTLQGKYTCNIEIDGTKIVTLTGALWVSGNFDMANSAQLKLAPSFGSFSSVVIADNTGNRTTSSKISVSNSAQILGSGQAGSYIMVVSRNNSAELGGDETAIEVGNSSAAAIYYAPHGLISLQNNVNLKEATSWKMHLKNSATVTYEGGLANVQFSSGPTGGFKLQSWTEIAE